MRGCASPDPLRAASLRRTWSHPNRCCHRQEERPRSGGGHAEDKQEGTSDQHTKPHFNGAKAFGLASTLSMATCSSRTPENGSRAPATGA